MGIIEDVFLIEGKECKHQERLKREGENSCQREEGALAWDRICVGQWQWMRRDLWQPLEVQWGRTGSKKRNETPQGMWLSIARIGSLWICYARSLAGKQKSGS